MFRTLIILLGLLAASCLGCRAHDVRLENRTSHPLVNARVEYAGLGWPRLNIDPWYDAAYFYATVAPPPTARVVWRSGGEDHVLEAPVREALPGGRWFGGTVVLTVRDDRTLTVRHEPEREPGIGSYFRLAAAPRRPSTRPRQR